MSPSIHRVVVLFVLGFGLATMLASCAKKPVAKSSPPPPPPAPAPSASLAASPNDLKSGQSATLTWTTTNATQASISGIGNVSPNGSTTIRPTASTTFVLTATGPGGSKEATARITVTALPPAISKATPTDEELFSQSIHDVFFAYDKSSVAANQETAVQQDAKFLAAHPYMKIVISGHCDERGSEDYNLALGDNRATTVDKQLQNLGISPDRIRTITYGKEKPFCTEETEACWQLNRRAHFSLQP